MRARLYYRFSSIALTVCAVLNFALAIYVFSVAGDAAVVTNVRVIEPHQITFPTNSLPSFPSSPPGFSSPSSSVAPDFGRVQSAPEVHSYRYDYFVSYGRPGAYLNGRYLYVGDRTAFGIVSDVFPERLYFSDGSYIINLALEDSRNEYSRSASTVSP